MNIEFAMTIYMKCKICGGILQMSFSYKLWSLKAAIPTSQKLLLLLAFQSSLARAAAKAAASLLVTWPEASIKTLAKSKIQ